MLEEHYKEPQEEGMKWRVGRNNGICVSSVVDSERSGELMGVGQGA